MINIERLYAMPTMQKVEGGYAYPEQYIRNLYSFENKIFYFASETLCEEIPSYLIPIITSLIEAQTTDLETDLINKSDELLSQVANKLSELELKITNANSAFISDIEVFKVDIDKNVIELNNINKIEILAEINEKLNTLNSILDNIQSVVDVAVDKKLVDVYTNFDVVVKQLVADNVKLIEQDVKNSGNKFKITEIAMLKETGLDIADIIQLRKEGMI